MHIRTSRVTRNGKTYEYHQLVESFRRPSDGVPSCRVITTFNQDQALEVENLRCALAAARKGKRVAVARTTNAVALKPTANLRYLDLAVLLELWRQWHLDELFDELMPVGAERLRPAAVVTALSLQRCVDPGSKLYATRWMSRTALVELLNLDPKSFNNTRIHRTLDDLDGATSALMSKLARRYEERDGAFAAMFLDVTDAWFVGLGPSLAACGKTKEGMIRKKIGVVLLCNQHGYPLRWEVIPGNQEDGVAMHRTLRAVAGLSWARDVPIVFDRAMGNTKDVVAALATGLRFLTALCVNEIDAYAPALPHACFSDLAPREHVPREVEEAAQRAEQAGMKKEGDNLFVLDLGIVVRSDASPDPEIEKPSVTADNATVRAMRLCRKVKQDVDDGRFVSFASAGRAAGLSNGLTKKYLQLGKLPEQAQRDVLDGRASGCTIADLLDIAAKPDADARQQAFVALLATKAARPSRSPARCADAATGASSEDKPNDPVRVRVVVFFNPDRFVAQRVGARQKIAGVDACVAKLNKKLASSRCKDTQADVAATVKQMLRGEGLREVFDVDVDAPSSERPHLFVRVQLDVAKWARRRRYDGFCALVAHPDVAQSAADLCRLYREKDAVEKDFRTIKSVVELRPIWHQTDAKVRAHVTLCMLALLLERTLERRLGGHASAESTIQELASCQLNLYTGKSSPPAYVITHINPEQRSILSKLRLQQLADDQELADRISPRQAPPPPDPTAE